MAFRNAGRWSLQDRVRPQSSKGPDRDRASLSSRMSLYHRAGGCRKTPAIRRAPAPARAPPTFACSPPAITWFMDGKAQENGVAYGAYQAALWPSFARSFGIALTGPPSVSMGQVDQPIANP